MGGMHRHPHVQAAQDTQPGEEVRAPGGVLRAVFSGTYRELIPITADPAVDVS